MRQELFDTDIERRVGRMQRVIELARVSRERRGIGLKTPLKSLVVVQSDPQYLKDVKSLETYITEELNVRDLVLSNDEDKYNIQYSVTADWPVLGKKLKKDMVRVKKALPTVTSDDVKSFVKDGFMILDGIRLEKEDLVVRRGVREDESSKNLETNTDESVLTILDAELYGELAHEGIGREIINRVQRLRKKAGLQPTDDIKMEYSVLSDPEKIGIAEAFASQSGAIEKALRRPLDHLEGSAGIDERVIAEEEQEVQKATFLLRLLEL